MSANGDLLSEKSKDYIKYQDSLVPQLFSLIKEVEDYYNPTGSSTRADETFIENIALKAGEIIRINSDLLQELKEKKNELNRIYNVVNEGFYSRDIVHNKYNYLSAGCQKIYGYSTQDFIENVNLWYEVIHPEDLKIVEHANSVLSKGESVNSEYRIILKDKSVRWIEVSVVPFFTDGVLTQVEGIIKNINERKLAEQQLAEQNKELIKINSDLDRFVYSASHELRSPLTSILGLVNLAKLQKTEAEKDKLIDVIESCVLSLDGFIKDIIEYSKNNRVEVEHDEIDFENLIEEIKNPLKFLIESEKIHFSFELQQNAKFYSDRKRLAVVLSNLVSNSIKYFNPEMEMPFVKIIVKTNNKETELVLEDNGLGIEPKKIDKIFQMFYRANTEQSGSGLGLYIVKEILDRLGGKIQVQKS
ncbi:MAG: PAS domain-containing sensor histidine kinase, partial [Daejeonella sp.]